MIDLHWVVYVMPELKLFCDTNRIDYEVERYEIGGNCVKFTFKRRGFNISPKNYQRIIDINHIKDYTENVQEYLIEKLKLEFYNSYIDSTLTRREDHMSMNKVRPELQWKDASFNPRLAIEKVIFNPPATIVFWKCGSKTVVKCKEGETYDPEVGLAMAYLKHKAFDDFHKLLRKARKEYESQNEHK